MIGGRIIPIPARVQVISGMAAPATADELRSFLGTTGFFRRFVVSYAERASALTDLLRTVDADAKAAVQRPDGAQSDGRDGHATVGEGSPRARQTGGWQL